MNIRWPVGFWAPLTLVILGATACITAADLDGRLKSWVGKDSDRLAAEWGAPSGTYQKQDGSFIYSYDRLGIVSTGPGYFSRTFSVHCRVDFVTDKGHKIVGASWHGAIDECGRSIIGADGMDQ